MNERRRLRADIGKRNGKAAKSLGGNGRSLRLVQFTF